jgi:hypothetical protein
MGLFTPGHIHVQICISQSRIAPEIVSSVSADPLGYYALLTAETKPTVF